jgi:hypothetical protein
MNKKPGTSKDSADETDGSSISEPLAEQAEFRNLSREKR